jgi:helicase-like protein
VSTRVEGIGEALHLLPGLLVFVTRKARHRENQELRAQFDDYDEEEHFDQREAAAARFGPGLPFHGRILLSGALAGFAQHGESEVPQMDAGGLKMHRDAPRELLGHVTTPSGILVVLDFGTLDLWSHEAPPSTPESYLLQVEPGTAAAMQAAEDLRIEGPDAEAAGRAFRWRWKGPEGLQPDFVPPHWPPRVLFDIPGHQLASLREQFEAFTQAEGLDARLVSVQPRISHRQRVAIALEAGGGAGEVRFHRITAVAVSGLPVGRKLPVYGTRMGGEYSDRWSQVALEVRPEGAVRSSKRVGIVAVDCARLMFADVEALGVWKHVEPIDGKADFVFWGRDAEAVARLVSAPALGSSQFGWMDLPVEEAVERGLPVEKLRETRADLKFATDFRPHSHHFRLLEQARDSPTESGVLELGGATVCGFFTTWGDGFFPSSLGLSVLVPPETTELHAEVLWGDYRALPGGKKHGKGNGDGQGHGQGHGQGDEEQSGGDEAEGTVWGKWRRQPRQAELTLRLADREKPTSFPVPGSDGLNLVVSARRVPNSTRLPEGTRSVSVFLVNERPPAPDVRRDAAFVFQPELRLRCSRPFVPRPDVRGLDGGDWDEKLAALQYRDAFEYVVGHNVAAVALTGEQGRCHEVRSEWMPSAEVEKVIPAEVGDVQLGMEALAAAKSAEDLRGMVGPMIEAYRDWIARQRATLPADLRHRQVAEEPLDRAETARGRIQAGLAALNDPQALEAFRIANRAVATALRQRATHGRDDLRAEQVPPPAWRPFQLAFLLMNLAGIADPAHPDRKIVDLLFFPTGGGKTEAYLGLAAFAIVLRRLRDPSVRSAGVGVLMRYTLRLLTLDQLGRAATLICALELERQQDVVKLGLWPLEIGLWVGQSATPNRMGKKGDKDSYSARAKTIAFQNDDKNKPSPIPLETCPWCGTKFNRNSFLLLPNADAPNDLRVSCVSRSCAFHTRKQEHGLPLLAVDEPIYRRLPCFLIATVDKFAGLPWVGETGGLFGRVERHDAEGFYGPARPGHGKPLEGVLPPPELVIQDELHLISGPLGTLVGLYETAIDALSARDFGPDGVRPKIVASTATVRRADQQIQALFCRGEVDVFPPPGPDRRNSFFARTVPPQERNARRYVGIAAQGRNQKVVLLRTYLALLGAAQKHWLAAGGARNKDNPADPYMTLVGYFNSLRELGGSRRIVEDEVKSRVADYRRRRRVDEAEGLFENRPQFHEPRELTSRVDTNEVAETKRRLALGFHDKDRVDVALATNMISVGLDITRLGLMVVLGQPKTAAEYIQATSRVGRDDERPGLVVTLMNVHRPRDRSHYERFAAWHESFYRAVEATSVTPFSPRAVDRGIAAVTVALARLGHPGMTAPRKAVEITRHRRELDFVAELISRRAEAHDKDLDGAEAEDLRQKIRRRVGDLLDVWQHIADGKGDLQYAREAGVSPPLLWDPLDPELKNRPQEEHKFTAHRSLRDVEPIVNLWVRNPDGLDVEEETS